MDTIAYSAMGSKNSCWTSILMDASTCTFRHASDRCLPVEI